MMNKEELNQAVVVIKEQFKNNVSLEKLKGFFLEQENSEEDWRKVLVEGGFIKDKSVWKGFWWWFGIPVVFTFLFIFF